MVRGCAGGCPVNAQEWNERVPVGTPVTAFPLTRDDASLETRTRSVAWELGHGEPVVLVDGHVGGIYLTHVDVAEAGEPCDR